MQQFAHVHPPQSPRRRIPTPPGGNGRRRSYRLILFAKVLAILMISATSLRAQNIIDGSFEGLNVSTAIAAGATPGWWAGTGITYPYAFPGAPTGSWYSYLGSIDIFWPTAYVPINFMTTMAGRTPYHGEKYGGISTGTFISGFGSEVMVGSMATPISNGTYQVRAQLAMGSARGNPCRIQFSLISSTTSAPPLVVGSMLVTNTAWNLFSQSVSIALPAGQSYNRLRIEGVVDANPANNMGAYCFVDSVDVTGVSKDPCDYVSARAEYQPLPSGSGCCWKLFINNSMPTWMTQVFFVRLTSVAPSTLSGPPSNGPGLSSTPALPYVTTWHPSMGGPFPIGAGQYVGTYCLNPGPPPQKQIIEFLGPNLEVLCRDTIWTDCQPEPPTPCMDVQIRNVLCGPTNAAGNRTYSLTMLLNVLNPVPGYVTFSSPNGTLSSWGTWVPAYSQAIPLTFTDTPPVDGHVCIYLEHHAYFRNRDSIVCRDTVCFDLPQCPEDCCSGFLKAIGQVKISVNNGSVTLSGCAMAGLNQIKRFSATIVAAQSRSRCGVAPAGAWTRIFGDIVGGALSGSPLGPPSFVPTMLYSREIVWGGTNYWRCVPFNPCVPFSLNMMFPNPPASSFCHDSLRFSIRYSWTDCQCRTCDTVITYQVPRRFRPIIWGGGDVIDHAGEGTTTSYVKPDPGLLNLTMSSSTTGTLSVTLPNGQPGDPVIRIVGMMVRPEGVPLLSMTEQNTPNSATIAGNAGVIATTIDEGQTRLFNLSYINQDNDARLRHLAVFRYIDLSDSTNPPDTLTSDTVVFYGVTPAGAGDVVEATQSNLQNVRTYALHLVASNGLNEAVHGLRLSVNGGATLIAVGPVGDGSNAVLTPGSDNGGNAVVQVDKNTWTVNDVAAGTTLDPIYLTFAGVGVNNVTVDYTTMGEDGTALSSGSAQISSPLRVAGVEDLPTAETGSELLPIYPNPTSHSATVQFDLRGAGRGKVLARDLRGNEVLRLIDGEQLNAGAHLVPIDTRALPPGTYVVTMEVDGRLFTRPLTIVK